MSATDPQPVTADDLIQQYRDHVAELTHDLLMTRAALKNALAGKNMPSD